MALEKFEYPDTGSTVTYSWTPAENPLHEGYVPEPDEGVVTDISAGGKMYAYGQSVWICLHRRQWRQLSASDRNAFEHFKRMVAANYFKYVDVFGAPHKVKFAEYRVPAPYTEEGLYDLACVVREELPVYAINFGKAIKFVHDLLFYAPIKADLECFNRWNVTKTYVNTNPYTLRAYPLLTEATPAGPQVNATDGLIKARGESISYANGYPVTVAPIKGSVFFIQKGNDGVARSYCLTYDTSVPTSTQYENGVADATRTTDILAVNFENGKLFESDDSLVNLRIRDVMTFGRPLTAAELLDVHNTMI